uniref:Uncharacterized protein n=1 Tax=Cucumis melo TaxID=3656 RepID=A0A9I9E2M3_CUCME
MNLLWWFAIEQMKGDMGACDRADEKGHGITI